VLAIVGDGRREGDGDGKEVAAIERGRSEGNSRASGEDCRKRWS
jgi:hypothetical protein